MEIIADLKDCNIKKLDNIQFIEQMLYQACKEAEATPLGIKTVKFNPYGLSSILILAESHISIHTYPERGYCALDIFTCGKKAKPLKAFEYIKNELEAKEYNLEIVKRRI